jgi:hypothetical protein
MVIPNRKTSPKKTIAKAGLYTPMILNLRSHWQIIEESLANLGPLLYPIDIILPLKGAVSFQHSLGIKPFGGTVLRNAKRS